MSVGDIRPIRAGLLPLLCRRGHITKNEVGAIRIGGDESAVEIPAAVAPRFVAAFRRTAGSDAEGELMIAPMQGPPGPMGGGGHGRAQRPANGQRPTARSPSRPRPHATR